MRIFKFNNSVSNIHIKTLYPLVISNAILNEQTCIQDERTHRQSFDDDVDVDVVTVD